MFSNPIIWPIRARRSYSNFDFCQIRRNGFQSSFSTSLSLRFSTSLCLCRIYNITRDGDRPDVLILFTRTSLSNGIEKCLLFKMKKKTNTQPNLFKGANFHSFWRVRLVGVFQNFIFSTFCIWCTHTHTHTRTNIEQKGKFVFASLILRCVFIMFRFLLFLYYTDFLVARNSLLQFRSFNFFFIIILSVPTLIPTKIERRSTISRRWAHSPCTHKML